MPQSIDDHYAPETCMICDKPIKERRPCDDCHEIPICDKCLMECPYCSRFICSNCWEIHIMYHERGVKDHL